MKQKVNPFILEADSFDGNTPKDKKDGIEVNNAVEVLVGAVNSFL